jgi:hypothetical protein
MADETHENVQKTAEELKKQQERDAKEREAFLASRVQKLSLDGLDKGGLEQKVRQLYDSVAKLEEEKYDWEFKLRKLDFEINELNIAVNDIKGHFVKPPLKKISKTEQKLAKIAEVKSKLHSAFRENLKSTGQSKFALDEKEEPGKKPEWGQDQLKQHPKGEEEGLAGEEAAADEQEEEEEEEEEE